MRPYDEDTCGKTKIDDVLLVKNERFRRRAGFFVEVFRKDMFEGLGLPASFVQLNHSRSSRNILRGLHFQWEPPMGKLMRVTRGKAFLVAVDLRVNSRSLGDWFAMELSESDRTQIWAPAGFARGFCVLSDFAEIQYLCTGVYNGSAEAGIRWDDPDVGIDWPIEHPILSEKDRIAPSLSQWLKRSEANRFVAEVEERAAIA